jgi:hypothetical protein
MARAGLKVHADCPDGIVVSVLRAGNSWEFRGAADPATVARAGFRNASPCWFRSAITSAGSSILRVENDTVFIFRCNTLLNKATYPEGSNARSTRCECLVTSYFIHLTIG